MPGSQDRVLEIRRLIASYSTRGGEVIRALENCCFDLAVGEVLGIVGESGCGKSTLAKALLRLLPANATCESGVARFQDKNLLTLSERELNGIRGRQVSLISQHPALALNPVITVGTQIEEVLRAHLPLTSRQRRDRVMELLREVGFDQTSEIYGAYPHQLSGGQRQRIVVAQAIACGPALVIADEPTSNLDTELRSEITNLFADMRAKRGMALIVITHDLSVIAAIADRVAFMYRGRIVELGKREEVFRRPMHPYSQSLLQIARFAHIDRNGTRNRFPTIADDLVDSAVASAPQSI